jgi:hypothetical protein
MSLLILSPGAALCSPTQPTWPSLPPQVQYTCDASLTYHVRPARLCRVAPRPPAAATGSPQLLICASTTTYRRLARSQVRAAAAYLTQRQKQLRRLVLQTQQPWC